ncbi:hypothetical protein [Streptomyces axinellae]|uniref:Uncharacterized protein n=1 Tax=Streptomyces axinellae TaxID=552788 RepID=A0ABN3QLH6_9ACTN
MGEDRYLLLVLAADGDDYVDWCRRTGRVPLDGTNAWAISSDTGDGLTTRRTFQVTDRWRENRANRRILERFRAPLPFDTTVRYGDENGPWPEERVPDLSWPSTWRRLLHRAA